ncbi:hypothetical protein [Pseudomarimonas arenosa]|uniref:Lipoprotein n=1 Tax=Pseudomarimonas arenosa TaxID=2774145 RepID=A0AAW3ZPX3_9GAMM|nr:hypothetical protein [Pseudomarimonas arenosa]MBD8527214.1 hypothetical protein [Pseudomarimonas arenosa]
MSSRVANYTVGIGRMTQVAIGMAAVLGVVGTAVAQDPGYRDQPPVMQSPDYGPSSQQRWQEAFDSLRIRYADRGPLRIAVYWGKQIDSEAHSRVVDVEVSETVTGAAAATVRAAGYASEVEHGAGVRVERSATVRGQARLDNSESSALSRHQGWDLETRFNQVLRQAGVSLVRSDLAARQAREKGEGDANQLEIRGLNQSADLILEVEGRPDYAQPTGWEFRVTATALKNSQIVAEFVTSAIPPAGPRPRFVAGPDGFERERPADISEYEVAQQLALEVAQQILGRSR